MSASDAHGRGAQELRAVYRLQLTPSFGFAAARSLVTYLRDLGISHLYLSPSLQARPGSMHGYDVIDPRRLSDELGGDDEFRALAAATRDAGMGIVLDVVPNHMGVSDQNRYWADPELREKFFDIDPVSGRHRRFFDIDDLAGVRQEDPEVFEETHALLLSLVHSGLVDGLRIDHPDGLADPAGYLARLAERGVDRVWVEKILTPSRSPEKLRDWPVSGTVGYEFLNDVQALFVDRSGEEQLTALWHEVSGDRRSFGEIAREAKLEQAHGAFWPDVERLGRAGAIEDLDGLAVALSSLPVYRTYVDPLARRVADADREALAGIDPALRRKLLLEDPAPAEFVTRFQQSTPALMAKGVEDTAFYRYGRLLALNDVGGDPSRFGISVEQFHEANRERAERFPLNLLTTQTHDAKRSGEVRARIGSLASMPSEWVEAVGRWFESTDSLRASNGAPDDPERYFIFQTLVGSWPIEVERIEAYMEKALREAKRNTNWVEQNHDWEDAVKRFCRALYSHRPFLELFEPFAARVRVFGQRSALRQHVLKLTVPGIPDVYQGHELPRTALVDPDNRRPVDWDFYQASLRRLMGGGRPDDEIYKLFLTMRLLGLRARNPEPFAGGYEPVHAGAGACAFLRGGSVLVVVVREGAPVSGRIEAPRGRWRDVISGEDRSFTSSEELSRVVDARGIGVFEHVGR